jgi:hypothetical protein
LQPGLAVPYTPPNEELDGTNLRLTPPVDTQAERHKLVMPTRIKMPFERSIYARLAPDVTLALFLQSAHPNQLGLPLDDLIKSVTATANGMNQDSANYDVLVCHALKNGNGASTR